MIRTLRWLTPLLFGVAALSFATSQGTKEFTIKSAKTPAPKELSLAIQKLLADSSVQLLDGAGDKICEVWFRNELPTEAAPEQLKTGVTYREVKQTEILGAIQFHRDWTDYRKHKVPAGVYTLRLAYQPASDAHTDQVSEFKECALVISAKADTEAGLIEVKSLHEKSGASIDRVHPGIFLLWPNTKPGKEPDLAARPKNHWVLNSKCNLVVDGKATGATIGIGLNLVGHSPVE